jgi:hypothetical protein
VTLRSAPDTPAERTAEYERLFGQHLVGRERTAEGIRFRLRADEGLQDWVRDLSAREKACCPFADFTISTVDGEIHWDISVVDDEMARAVLEEFYRIPDRIGEHWTETRKRLHDLGFSITTG